MSRIISKTHKYGHDCESEWPPRFPEKPGAFSGYWDQESQTFREGCRPNPNNQFGTPPLVIFDSMPKTYHEGVGREIESRKEWEAADIESGSLTFSSFTEPQHHTEKGRRQEMKELKGDRRKASIAANQAYKENPKEVSAKVKKRGEKQIEALKKAGLTKELKQMGVRYE